MRLMKKENLKDISNINIDMSQSVEKRREQFIKEIVNPYMFTCNGVIVQVEFKGESRLEDKFIKHIIKCST